jgi:hypothetical protein
VGNLLAFAFCGAGWPGPAAVGSRPSSRAVGGFVRTCPASEPPSLSSTEAATARPSPGDLELSGHDQEPRRRPGGPHRHRQRRPSRRGVQLGQRRLEDLLAVFVDRRAGEVVVSTHGSSRRADALLGSQKPRPYSEVSPEALPRALDHLNVVWKALTQQRLFYPRGLAGAANLVEPVISGDQLTARLGALADVFDLFMRTADGKQQPGGSLNAFRDQVVNRLPSGSAQDQARAAVGQFIDINRIRNGRLHTDATNWAEALQRLGVPSSESPTQQWERIRSAAVAAVYTIIELLQPLISLAGAAPSPWPRAQMGSAIAYSAIGSPTLQSRLSHAVVTNPGCGHCACTRRSVRPPSKAIAQGWTGIGSVRRRGSCPTAGAVVGVDAEPSRRRGEHPGFETAAPTRPRLQ